MTSGLEERTTRKGTRTSGKAVGALFMGALTVVCGLYAVASSDAFLIGVVFFWVLALILGILSWIEIKRASGALRGKALAGWGMFLPVGGFALGFLLLPVT